MTDAYHVIVKRKDGSLTKSDKEKESSAIKSAKAFINFKQEPAALVIQNKKIIFSLPEEPDKKFVSEAMKKAYDTGPEKPTHVKPAIKPATPDKTIVPAERIRSLASQYEKEVGAGQIVIPKTQRKADPCTIKILENACVASSLGQGVPLEAAKLICHDSGVEIETLAIRIASGSVTLDQALEELVGAKMEEEKAPVTPVSNAPNIAKIMRGRKDKIFPKTRVREDIGTGEEDLNTLKNRQILEGIIIYIKKEHDQKIHDMIAFSMGYTPSSLVNMHYPSRRNDFDYERTLSLMRPSYKDPLWRGAGGRIGNPSILVKRIQDQFSNEEVKIEIANGVELA